MSFPAKRKTSSPSAYGFGKQFLKKVERKAEVFIIIIYLYNGAFVYIHVYEKFVY